MDPDTKFENAFAHHECKSRKELTGWCRHLSRTRGFKGPFAVNYLTVPSENAYYLHVAVNHAMGDAGVIMPLCKNLLQVIDGEEIHPIPNAITLQAERTKAGLFDEDRADAVNLSWLNPLTWKRRGFLQYLVLDHTAVARIRKIVTLLHIPLDQMIVTLLVTSVARLRLTEEKDLDFLPIKLLIPNRDGAGEDEIVGNFTSDRDLELSTQNQTLVGAASEILCMLKNRKWRLPAADDPWLHKRVCINLRASLTELYKGAKNVQEYDIPGHTALPHPRAHSRSLESLLECFADECDDGRWILQCRICHTLPNGTLLADMFKQTLHEYLESPGVALSKIAIPIPVNEDVSAKL